MILFHEHFHNTISSVVTICFIWSKFQSQSHWSMIAIRKTVFNLCISGSSISALVDPADDASSINNNFFGREVWVSKFQSFSHVTWCVFWMLHLIFLKLKVLFFQFGTEMVTINHLTICFADIIEFSQWYNPQKTF